MASRKILGAVAMTAALTTGGAVGVMLGSPITSSAQDGTTTTAPATGDSGADGAKGGPLRRAAHVDLAVAAKALGITADELRTELQAGKTIAQVAEAQGVDKQTVIDALVAAGEKRLDALKESLPDRMAKLVDGTLRDELGHRDGPGGIERPGLDAAAEVLGLTTDELKTQLRDGTSLADIAAAKGVDKQAVIDALVAASKARIAEAVEAGKLTQEQADTLTERLADRITKMVDGERMGRFGGRHPGAAPDADEGDTGGN